MARYRNAVVYCSTRSTSQRLHPQLNFTGGLPFCIRVTPVPLRFYRSQYHPNACHVPQKTAPAPHKTAPVPSASRCMADCLRLAAPARARQPVGASRCVQLQSSRTEVDFADSQWHALTPRASMLLPRVIQSRLHQRRPSSPVCANPRAEIALLDCNRRATRSTSQILHGTH